MKEGEIGMAKPRTFIMKPECTKTVIKYTLEELVLCGDCAHNDGNGTCMKNGIAMLTDNWFCADGEAKSYE